jgi:hypothetical protein
MKEAVLTSETSVYSNETTRRYIPEGSNLHNEILFVIFLDFHGSEYEYDSFLGYSAV